MRTFQTARFEDAERYSSYLKTSLGRLRSEVAWENLRVFLPADGSRRPVLDLGGGTGSMSLRLAKMGFQVVLLDFSEEMLEVARKDAETCGVAGQVCFLHEDASKLEELFAAKSFDLIVCHNLLEYVADPNAIIAKIASVLSDEGVISVLVRNRAGEVLKTTIKSADWALAKAALSAETVMDSLYGKPVRVFDRQVIMDSLDWAGLDVFAQRGVRIFSDYLDSSSLAGEAAYQHAFDLESTLGARQEFAGIARYLQFMARRRSGFVKKEGAR
jgi:S-adenosylmethionine-dependent methyltransferase